jgi:hypothetical protein
MCAPIDKVYQKGVSGKFRLPQPVPFSLNIETAREEAIESSHDAKHVLVEEIQSSRFFGKSKTTGFSRID